MVRADVAVNLLSDKKFTLLGRREDVDAAAWNAAVVAYVAVLLASWGSGEREVVTETLPHLAFDPPLPAMIAVGLLDEDGCIPEKAWAAWYEEVQERIAQRSEAGRRGGIATAARMHGSATPVNGGATAVHPAEPSRAEPSVTRPSRADTRTFLKNDDDVPRGRTRDPAAEAFDRGVDATMRELERTNGPDWRALPKSEK